MSLFERYIVTRGDGRRTRWFREASRMPDAPAALLRLVDKPDAMVDMSRDEILAIDAWSSAAGLGDPPLIINDRYDERPEARAFADQLNRAWLGTYAVAAMRELLLMHDDVLTIAPDSDGEDVWHCRIGDSTWGTQGSTPGAALQAFVDMMVADLDRRETDA